MIAIYPKSAAERDRWILARRPARNAVDPRRPFGFLLEEERAESSEVVSVATIFLTNRECPWRCLMCDLWKNTLSETVPVGAIPAQIDFALAELSTQREAGFQSAASDDAHSKRPCLDSQARMPALRQIKLYNSGSFFDPRAILAEDYPAIAERVSGFERVIVECHPALVGERCFRFRELLENRDDKSRRNQREKAPAKLEVAMGLETAHPEVLEKLNKRMTLDGFRRAAEFLRKNDLALRVFVLVKPPFILDEPEALHWAKRSIDFAFDCGATAVSLIPTRFGNGALEALAKHGEFAPPKLATLEAAVEYGIGLKRGRVFSDLWDLEKFSDCVECFEQRHARLREMNLRQVILPPAVCAKCRSRTA